jgi:hypothetical protein
VLRAAWPALWWIDSERSAQVQRSGKQWEAPGRAKEIEMIPAALAPEAKPLSACTVEAKAL